MAQASFRHELKHSITLADYYALRPRLGAITRPDPHAGPDGTYRVRSVYFDTPSDRALREKLDGVSNRDKFRIRRYIGADHLIRLERKSKRNGLCQKTSALLTQQQCQLLLAGDIEWMVHSQNPLILTLYAKMRYEQLRPRTVVDYQREPFIYAPGNVRLTFDSDIRTGLNATDLLKDNLSLVPTGQPGILLLEVKYDAFLPDIIRDAIQLHNRHAEAFSKYAACRIYG